MPPTRAGLSPTPRRLLMCAVASASEGSWGAVSESGRLRQGAAGPREAPQRANVAYALWHRLLRGPGWRGPWVADWVGGLLAPESRRGVVTVSARPPRRPVPVSVGA